MTVATIYRNTDPIEDSVFFVGATDGRFTLGPGRAPYAQGAKIWALTRSALAVFAGAVAEAECALS
jgi:hypothetical protein